MSFTPIGAAGIFSTVFDFDVTSTAVFNTTGDTLEIKVPSRFETYLSDRAKSRLEPAADGNGKAYTVSGGAPLANGTFDDAGPYAVFLMNGSLTLATCGRLRSSAARWQLPAGWPPILWGDAAGNEYDRCACLN
jgi:hypothetical protein